MQLKIQRSQRLGGTLGNTIFFCLDVRSDYSPAEADNIKRYKLGNQIIYNSQAARRHLEQMGAHLNRTQSDKMGDQAAGLARGALSLALAKMSLNISIQSLGRGHHIECKDLEELLEAEETVRTACKNLTRYLDAAATFDGSEIIVEYANGEEHQHITQSAAPLLQSVPTDEVASVPAPSHAAREVQFRSMLDPLREAWARSREGGGHYMLLGVALVFVFVVIHSCT